MTPKARGFRVPKSIWVTVGLVLAVVFAGPSLAASAAGGAVNQCNGTDNVGGQSVTCDVTIVNTLDQATGVASSTTTVRECHGAAMAEPTCITTTSTDTVNVTAVTQCDGAGNGGGGTVTCKVTIINNITGSTTPTGATVNQCNSSGTGGGTEPTIVCDPIGNTTMATITQCNEAGNGGGGTTRVLCTVGPSTQTAALPITVDQCNGSGNGGGAVVICQTSLVNNVRAAAVTPVPVPTDTPTTPTDTPTPGTVVPPADVPTTDTPATPATPVIPNTPNPGAPELPVTPVTPSAPEQPVTPEAPATPGTETPPTTPNVKTATPDVLPETGLETAPTVMFALIALALGALLLGARNARAGRMSRSSNLG